MTLKTLILKFTTLLRMATMMLRLSLFRKSPTREPWSSSMHSKLRAWFLSCLGTALQVTMSNNVSPCLLNQPMPTKMTKLNLSCFHLFWLCKSWNLESKRKVSPLKVSSGSKMSTCRSTKFSRPLMRLQTSPSTTNVSWSTLRMMLPPWGKNCSLKWRRKNQLRKSSFSKFMPNVLLPLKSYSCHLCSWLRCLKIWARFLINLRR